MREPLIIAAIKKKRAYNPLGGGRWLGYYVVEEMRNRQTERKLRKQREQRRKAR